MIQKSIQSKIVPFLLLMSCQMFIVSCAIAKPTEPPASSDTVSRFTIELTRGGEVKVLDQKGNALQQTALSDKPIELSNIQNAASLTIFNGRVNPCKVFMIVNGRWVSMTVPDNQCPH